MPDGYGDKIPLLISSIQCHAVEMREGQDKLGKGTKGNIQWN